jgi:alpha-tubulin suppressor-like RCC1 family protein
LVLTRECRGTNSKGELGDGTTIGRFIPDTVVMSGVLSGKTITQIGIGSNFVVVLTSDNKLFSW